MKSKCSKITVTGDRAKRGARVLIYRLWYFCFIDWNWRCEWLCVEGGRATRTLHEVELTLFNRSMCNQPSWYANLLTHNMICAGDISGGRGTCTGDSGGPLACVDASLSTWRIYGLTSWAKVPCAGPDSPTIFTRVSVFIDWINNHIQKLEGLLSENTSTT